MASYLQNASFLQNTTYNLPVLSIIGYSVLCIVPHFVAVSIAYGDDPGKLDNTNPHGAEGELALKKKLGPKKFAAYERAESCQRNHFENFPLFVAAIFAGLLAEERLKTPLLGGLSASAAAAQIGVTAFSVGWLALRVLYTANYITTTSKAFAAVRSLLYFAGNGWAFTILVKSAYALAA
jgi:uncharacterized MAPEG superfamily protein